MVRRTCSSNVVHMGRCSILRTQNKEAVVARRLWQVHGPYDYLQQQDGKGSLCQGDVHPGAPVVSRSVRAPSFPTQRLMAIEWRSLHRHGFTAGSSQRVTRCAPPWPVRHRPSRQSHRIHAITTRLRAWTRSVPCKCPMQMSREASHANVPRSVPCKCPAKRPMLMSREASHANVPRSVPCKCPMQMSREASHANVPRSVPCKCPMQMSREASHANVPRSVPCKCPMQMSHANVPC